MRELPLVLAYTSISCLHFSLPLSERFFSEIFEKTSESILSEVVFQKRIPPTDLDFNIYNC